MANFGRHLIVRLFSNEDGATLVEYVLLVALVVMGALLGLKYFGLTVNNKLSSNNNTYSTSVAPSSSLNSRAIRCLNILAIDSASVQ